MHCSEVNVTLCNARFFMKELKLEHTFVFALILNQMKTKNQKRLQNLVNMLPNYRRETEKRFSSRSTEPNEPLRAIHESDYILNLIKEGEHVHQDFKFEISDARKIAKSLSAFANTEGGRLLVGVKDNGKIAGIRSEEEIYMIESAASMYCKPEVDILNRLFTVEGKHVLEVTVQEATNKPIYALDEQNKQWAYVRIKDENILANVVHLNYWKHNKEEEKVIMVYSEREQHILNILAANGPLTLNQCSRMAHISRKETSELLADFIRFNLVRGLFKEHIFYYQLVTDEEGDGLDSAF